MWFIKPMFSLLVLVCWCVLGGCIDFTRWEAPVVNNVWCKRDICVITEPYNYTSNFSRTEYLDLSRFMFTSNVTIISDHITHIKPPKKMLKNPLQTVIIRTQIDHENAIRLRKVFFDNDATILGTEECVVTGNYLPKGCHHVIGDLKITQNFKLPKGKEEYVESVTGCIHIHDTDFTELDLDFLNGLVLYNNDCGSKKTLYQRIYNNKNLCKTILFPTLESFEAKRHCGKQDYGLPKDLFMTIVLFVIVFVGLASNIPFLIFANAQFAKHFWVHELEETMDIINNHVIAVMKWKGRQKQKTNTTDPSTGVPSAMQVTDADPKPQPALHNKEQEEIVVQTLWIRGWIERVIRWTSASIIVVIVFSVLWLKYGF